MEALAALHERGVIHQDAKVDSVILDWSYGQAKLTDPFLEATLIYSRLEPLDCVSLVQKEDLLSICCNRCSLDAFPFLSTRIQPTCVPDVRHANATPCQCMIWTAMSFFAQVGMCALVCAIVHICIQEGRLQMSLIVIIEQLTVRYLVRRYIVKQANTAF